MYYLSQDDVMRFRDRQLIAGAQNMVSTWVGSSNRQPDDLKAASSAIMEYFRASSATIRSGALDKLKMELTKLSNKAADNLLKYISELSVFTDNARDYESNLARIQGSVQKGAKLKLSDLPLFNKSDAVTSPPASSSGESQDNNNNNINKTSVGKNLPQVAKATPDEKLEKSKASEAKVSQALTELFQVYTKYDFSPHEKLDLAQRFSSAIGNKIVPHAPNKDSHGKTRKEKKKGRDPTPRKPRSKEEQDLMDLVDNLLHEVQAKSKASPNGKLDPTDQVFVDYQSAKKRLRSFRDQEKCKGNEDSE